jgi:hypothetical protein
MPRSVLNLTDIAQLNLISVIYFTYEGAVLESRQSCGLLVISCNEKNPLAQPAKMKIKPA